MATDTGISDHSVVVMSKKLQLKVEKSGKVRQHALLGLF